MDIRQELYVIRSDYAYYVNGECKSSSYHIFIIMGIFTIMFHTIKNQCLLIYIGYWNQIIHLYGVQNAIQHNVKNSMHNKYNKT